MKQQMAEIDAIAANPAAPSFENTIAALERSGRMLERVNNTFFAVVQANTNPALDKVQTMEAPKLAAHNDAIFLNAKLFARVKALYDQRAGLKLDPEALQVLTLYYRQFVHAGALLSDKDKTRLKADQQGRCQPGSAIPAEAGGGRQGGRPGVARQGRSCGPDRQRSGGDGGSGQGAQA